MTQLPDVAGLPDIPTEVGSITSNIATRVSESISQATSIVGSQAVSCYLLSKGREQEKSENRRLISYVLLCSKACNRLSLFHFSRALVFHSSHPSPSESKARLRPMKRSTNVL